MVKYLHQILKMELGLKFFLIKPSIHIEDITIYIKNECIKNFINLKDLI